MNKEEVQWMKDRVWSLEWDLELKDVKIKTLQDINKRWENELDQISQSSELEQLNSEKVLVEINHLKSEKDKLVSENVDLL